MAYINGNQTLFSSYILDGNGYYSKTEVEEKLQGKANQTEVEGIQNSLNTTNEKAIEFLNRKTV